MPALNWTAPALADLRAIDHWLEENASPEIALRTLATIRFRAGFLENFPHAGRPLGESMRALRVRDTPYLLLYRLLGEQLDVLRIRHEREDWLVEP